MTRCYHVAWAESGRWLVDPIRAQVIRIQKETPDWPVINIEVLIDV